LQRQVCEQLLADFSPLPEPDAILDAGCGTGYGMPPAARTLAGRPHHGGRLRDGMLPRAQRLPTTAWPQTSKRCPAATQRFTTWWSNLTVQWCDSDKVLPKRGASCVPVGNWR
jgi:hypothetical protein